MSGILHKIKEKATSLGHHGEHHEQAQQQQQQPQPQQEQPQPQPQQQQQEQRQETGAPGEQQFSTLPHPAKTNDPRDLQAGGGGFQKDPNIEAFHAHGPYVPDQNVASNLEQPASSEELRARSAELNK
ncbi:unnamed protein product [Somion occarium]|uniref:Uncharacterized protein n=1 Tax=Somion occarium TaxID=3059160 RepID=A0ABP1DSV0_9APHY